MLKWLGRFFSRRPKLPVHAHSFVHLCTVGTVQVLDCGCGERVFVHNEVGGQRVEKVLAGPTSLDNVLFKL